MAKQSQLQNLDKSTARAGTI